MHFTAGVPFAAPAGGRPVYFVSGLCKTSLWNLNTEYLLKYSSDWVTEPVAGACEPLLVNAYFNMINSSNK